MRGAQSSRLVTLGANGMAAVAPWQAAQDFSNSSLPRPFAAAVSAGLLSPPAAEALAAVPEAAAAPEAAAPEAAAALLPAVPDSSKWAPDWLAI